MEGHNPLSKIYAEIMSRSTHGFEEVKLMCTFRGDVVFEILFQYGPCLRKGNEKINEPNFKCHYYFNSYGRDHPWTMHISYLK